MSGSIQHDRESASKVTGKHKRIISANIPEIRLSMKPTQNFLEYHFDNTQFDVYVLLYRMMERYTDIKMQ
mgnify:FL=1